MNLRKKVYLRNQKFHHIFFFSAMNQFKFESAAPGAVRLRRHQFVTKMLYLA